MKAVSHNLFVLNSCSNLYHFVSEWSESYMWFTKWNTAIVFMGLFQGLQVSFLKSTNTRNLESLGTVCKSLFMNGDFQLNSLYTILISCLVECPEYLF